MRKFLTAQWEYIIMANYEIDPAILSTYLPKGVELDYFEGKTYVSLVGFMFKNTSIFKIPIPLMGTFEEVNLRFYVKRKVGTEIRRGVVFINETVPNKLVAYVANKLYKEHYIAIPTKHNWDFQKEQKVIKYEWKVNEIWNSIVVEASQKKQKMLSGSIEEYIFEHYFGYTKVNKQRSIEYKINHPSWEINLIQNHQIKCDFATFYGQDFKVLNDIKPNSVMLAEGSQISVDWKRVSF